MVDLRREEDKQLIREAIKEWADEKFAEFGKWTLKSVAVAAFSALIVFLVNHGWIK